MAISATMFNSTAELLYLAVASKHLIAFCFCNLIIVFLLVSSKPGSPLSQGIPTALPEVACAGNNSEHLGGSFGCRNGAIDLNEGDNSNTTLVYADNSPIDNNGEDNEGGDDSSELANTKEELEPENRSIDTDEGGDELRQRAEEFIAKVNRRWKAEMSGTFILA